MRAPATEPAPTPSYVVIGTSAGGVAALSRLFKDISSDFAGAIFIVIHARAPSSLDWLAEQLGRVGHLPVKVGTEGENIQQGTAYLAPPGTHLLVVRDRLCLGTGPREQYAKPAIDVLFRSAAETFGPRVIGVILTGMLRDGALGLRAVRDAGGITVVQNPDEAEEGEMPASAMHELEVDYCLELAEIGPLLDLLVRRAGGHKEGVLETGLSSAVRLMQDRVALLTKLYAQSRGNPRTAVFLEEEMRALDAELTALRKLLPLPRAPSKKTPAPRRAK